MSNTRIWHVALIAFVAIISIHIEVACLDENNISGSGLLCISDSVTCPVICPHPQSSPRQSPPAVVEYSPPPSNHTTKPPPSSRSPLSPLSQGQEISPPPPPARLTISSAPAPPMTEWLRYPYPYYYFYASKASSAVYLPTYFIIFCPALLCMMFRKV